MSSVVRPCARCGKTTNPFRKRDQGGAQHSYCTPCESAYRREHRKGEGGDILRKRSREKYQRTREQALAYQREYRVEHRDRILALEKKRAPKRAESIRERNRRQREEAPIKTQAQDTTKRAIRTGILVKGPCEVGVQCLGSVQAHHDDYEKTLEVRWLCRRHHQQWHAQHGEGANARNLPCTSGSS